jgi:hypothetical protein
MPILVIAIVAMWLGAGGTAVAGVAVLAGLGWALIAAGGFLAVSAAVLRMGMTPNG